MMSNIKAIDYLKRHVMWSLLFVSGLVCATSFGAANADTPSVPIADTAANRPNLVFILTDDHRWDSYGATGSQRVETPNLDRIAAGGTRFSHAFVTLAICSPSRAACLTGRYGSANGVTSVGKTPLNKSERTFAHALRQAGYATGVAGKWHLKTTPQECGFDFASTCWSNGTWYDRQFTIDGKTKVMPGFVDHVAADESIRFIDQSVQSGHPFVLWLCTQVPHMDHELTWPAEQIYLDRYNVDKMPLPETWNDDLSGKPEYLKKSRSRVQALKYGYDAPENIRRHARDYCASVEQMDIAVGRVLDEVERRGLGENTWIVFMGDNGWFLGEHGFTSKVLPYEESMRVPMAIRGPGTRPQVCRDLVLNIDLTATLFELAGLPVPDSIHGKSLLPLLSGKTPDDWRTSFLYEAPTPQLGSRPLWAVRNERWKYVETQIDEQQVDVELYDLSSDDVEMKNVADDPARVGIVRQLARELREHRGAIASEPQQPALERPVPQPTEGKAKQPVDPTAQSRTDLFISGVYPHLTTYGIYSQNGAHYKDGHNECGIGAVVPWAGKLWMVNYAPHMPRGSEHKLYAVAPDMKKPMTIHPDSVGGTPAGRMIHEESEQLLIGHHLVDVVGKVRTIDPSDMPIRVTAIARHLDDPANRVYYIDMEGSIWEANVHTLSVKRLFKKPVPGWHGKGGYTSQGRLIISNNGELHVGDYRDVLVGGKATTPEERGVLAEFDGTNWRIVERHQFTEVTGPKGITGGSDGDDPVWTIGWDRRSVRLKVLDHGTWHTYLLPKAAYCNDAKHGWYTEWPRIREITKGRWMMDMHGMFFDFPKAFSSTNSAGIRPIASHLRYVPDFCDWNGRLVLATDETSIQGNPLAGQPQSNLWFGDYEDLKTWGPASGYGGPWIDDQVTADTPSDPFLVAGFDRRTLHLAIGRIKPIEQQIQRTTDQLPITDLPVHVKIQVDQHGNGSWTDLETFDLANGDAIAKILPDDLNAVWLRLITDRDCVATAILHQTTSQFSSQDAAENKSLFSGLADIGEEVLGSLVYPAKRNRNLRVITDNKRFFDFTKADFAFQPSEPDAGLANLLHVEPEFTFDDASVIVEHLGKRLRLPRGNAAYDKPFASGWPRASREVESERHLANIHGTFYEVPLVTNGAPPAWNLMRPVSSHSKQITDFCSWNGLLVLSGIRSNAANDGHVFRDDRYGTGLWFGGIDDLWKFGKPIGHGGPWRDTQVESGIPSDPFLMKGYDKKTVTMSHQGSKPARIKLQIDLDGNGRWVDYQHFDVPTGVTRRHEFPSEFSACWIRSVCDSDTTATVQFKYR